MITAPTRHTEPPDGPSIPGPVLVMGTGAVGGWVGGRLAASGVPVHFVTRPATKVALRAQGLTTTDLDGLRVQVPASQLQLHDAVPAAHPRPPWCCWPSRVVPPRRRRPSWLPCCRPAR